jgi:hypothetical protein
VDFSGQKPTVNDVRKTRRNSLVMHKEQDLEGLASYHRKADRVMTRWDEYLNPW